MAEKTLWNIGTADAPIIQGQAGKPFAHQEGDPIQFPQGVQQVSKPDSQTDTTVQMQTEYQDKVISNKCLCNYKWYRYFAIYAFLPQAAAWMPFYQTSPAKFQDKTVQKPGYSWQLKTGYIYSGCKPKQGSLGIWQDMPFPYKQEGHLPNISTPSPSCLQRTNTGFATVKKMLVTSYKCCNGQAGCGKIVKSEPDAQNDPLLDVQRLYCQGWFNVSFDQTGKVAGPFDLKPYNIRCGKGHHEQKVQYTSCTTAKVRVFRQLFTSGLTDPNQEQCADCYSKLNTNLTFIKPPVCVNWALYRWNISDAEGCKVLTSPDLIVNYEGLPPTIVGRGGGCAPLEWHDTQPIYVCQDQTTAGSLGGAIYQWIPSDNCYQPANPPYNAPANKCKGNCQYPASDLQWDTPLSDGSNRDSTQPPCNIPDPPPYQYLQGVPSVPVTWQKFDVYRIRLQDMSQAQAIEKGLDPCKNWYTPQRLEGTTIPNWVKHLAAKYDYQLIDYIQTPVQRSSEAQPGQSQTVKNYKYLYHVVSVGEDVNVDFTAISGKQGVEAVPDGNKLCDYYFQVYFTEPKENCSQQQNIKSFVCAKWRAVGKLSQEQQGKLGLVTNMWQPATKQNTFGLAQRYPQIKCVYTVSFKKPAWCGQYPKLPQYHKTACVLPIPPECQKAALEVDYPDAGPDQPTTQYNPVESALQKDQWQFRDVAMSCQQFLQQRTQQGQTGKCVVCYGLVDIFSTDNKELVPGQGGIIIQKSSTTQPSPDFGEGGQEQPVCYAEYALAIQEYWGASKQQIHTKLSQIVDDLPEFENPCEKLTVQQKTIPPQLYFKYSASCYQGSKYIPMCAQIAAPVSKLTQEFWKQVQWKKLSPIVLDTSSSKFVESVQGFRTSCQQPQYGQAVPMDQQTGTYTPVNCKPIYYVTFLVQCKDQPQPKPNPKLCPIDTSISWPPACCVKFWYLELTTQTASIEKACQNWQQLTVSVDIEDPQHVNEINSLMSSTGFRTSIQIKESQSGPVFGQAIEKSLNVVKPASCKPIYYIQTTNQCQALLQGQKLQDIRPACPTDTQIEWPDYCCGNLVYLQVDPCTKTVDWTKIKQQDWKSLQLFGPRDQWTQETWQKVKDILNNRIGWRTSIKDQQLGQAVQYKAGAVAPSKCQPIYYITLSNVNCSGGPAVVPGAPTQINWPAGCSVKFRYVKWESPNKQITGDNCKWSQLTLPQSDDTPEVKTQLLKSVGWRTSIDVFYANQGPQFGSPVHQVTSDYIVPDSCQPVYYIQDYDSCDEEDSEEPSCPITTVKWPDQCCAGFRYVQVDPVSNEVPQKCEWKDIEGANALQPEQKKALLQNVGWRTSIDPGANFGEAVPERQGSLYPESCKSPIYYIQSYDACTGQQLKCPTAKIVWPQICCLKFVYIQVSKGIEDVPTSGWSDIDTSSMTSEQLSQLKNYTGWRTSNNPADRFGQAVPYDSTHVRPQYNVTGCAPIYFIQYYDSCEGQNSPSITPSPLKVYWPCQCGLKCEHWQDSTYQKYIKSYSASGTLKGGQGGPQQGPYTISDVTDATISNGWATLYLRLRFPDGSYSEDGFGAYLAFNLSGFNCQTNSCSSRASLSAVPLGAAWQNGMAIDANCTVPEQQWQLSVSGTFREVLVEPSGDYEGLIITASINASITLGLNC